MAIAAGTSLALLTLNGCAVGPDFAPPQTPAAAGYTPERVPAATASAPLTGGASQRFEIGRDIPGDWWKVFRSKELDALIAQALRSNPSLQAAQATLWQAKENLYAQAGVLLPNIDANSSATRQRFSPASFGQSGQASIFNLYQTTVNVSYAPDVFGGKRRAIEASEALAEFQRFELEASYLTLTSNVVTAAVQVASLRGQIDATKEILKAESDQLEVVRGQFNVGAANRADVLTQESEVANTRATLPPLEKQLEQQQHLLLTLTGRFPSEYRRDRLRLSSFRLPTHLPLSLASQLVEQRPDVRAAEQQLHQASAQIGVAIANRLPQFNLTASYGSSALNTASLFTPQNAIWSVAAAGTQPIFHGFSLMHQERAAKAAYDVADAQYRNTVLTAFQNVADALRALQLDAKTLVAQQEAARAASATLELSRSQYKLGAITYVTLLNAQRSYSQARLALVAAQAARFADTAALYQALGGGWWNRNDIVPNPYTPNPLLTQSASDVPVIRPTDPHQ
ncbi:MAG TPA: efflux transporter outer membrane subunit [Xanthobacteraceae bacterium]|jgi:NodT family efflux transporter outer membrane factor (OMF) lipoprotein